MRRRGLLLIALPVVLLLICGCNAQAPESPRAVTGGQKPEDLERAQAELQKGIQQVLDGEYEAALTTIFPQTRILKRSGRPDLAAEALFWTAFAHEKLGERDDAQVFYDQVIKEYPDTPAAEEARRRLAEGLLPAAP